MFDRRVAIVASAAREAFGRVDLALDNAGGVHFAPLEEIAEAPWDLVRAVSRKGPYLVSRDARVNALRPGVLPTHMWTHPLASEERGGPAAYAAFRARSTAPNVTGISLIVAGGMEMA